MGSLDGKKVCVTGTLRMSRKDVEAALVGLGASIASGVTKTTDLLVAGEKAGSKLKSAEKLGIPVLGQPELDALLAGESLADVLSSGAPESKKQPAETKPAEAPAKTKPAEAAPAKTKPTEAAPAGQPHAGVTFVLTGELDIDRDVAAQKLQALGAVVTGSVSGKTTALLTGSKPGASKVTKARSLGIPIIDAAGVVKLLGGTTLAELLADGTGAGPASEASPRSPLPDFVEIPRTGPHRTTHPGTDQTRSEGEYLDGKAHGTWRWFHEDGRPKCHLDYMHGLRHGKEVNWYASGQKSGEGEWRNDKQVGPWDSWYESGAFKQRYYYDDAGRKTGEYVWDLEDGSPRARGTFLEGKFDGQWTWWAESAHEKIERGYLKGMFHGDDAAWFPGGQLAYRKHWQRSRLHGPFEEHYPDGKPKAKGEYDQGRIVRMERWDENGQHTVDEPAEAGLPAKLLADRKKLERLAAKIAKAKDEYKKEEVLGSAVEYGLRYPLLVHLWREGLVSLENETALWRFVGEATEALTGEDVARLLSAACELGHAKLDALGAAHLAGWPRPLDEIVMRVYARDPGPIDAVFDSLSGMVKVGVAFCRARFGQDMSAAIGDQSAALADQHVNHHGIGSRILWPVEGSDPPSVDWRELFDGQLRDVPGPLFGRFLELLTTPEKYREAVLQAVLERVKKESVYPAKLYDSLATATPEQLTKILPKISVDQFTVDNLEKLLLEWREDDAETLRAIALEMSGSGLTRWPVVSCAILRFASEGRPVPDTLVDALELDGGSISLGWVDDAIRKVPELHLHDPAFIDGVVSFADHESPGSPRNGLLVRALRALSEAQRRAVLEKQLASPYGKQNAALYLHLVDDEAFWDRAIEAIVGSDYGYGHTVAFGLGMLPLRALPLILASKAKAKKKEAHDAIDRAAVLCIARALEGGESIDDAALSHVRFDLGGKYDWTYVMPILRKVIHRLPRAQAEAVLRGALDPSRPQVFARAFRCVGSHPTRAVLDRAMNGLLDAEATIQQDDEREIEAGLRGLPDTRLWLKWLVRNGGGSKLSRAFENAAGGTEKYAALKQELAAEGAEVKKELDAIEKLELLAARVLSQVTGGATAPIYAFRKLDKPPATPTLNRRGGLPPGVGPDRWPQKDDEPMVHLFTLDLATMPELAKAFGGKRALGFFCWSPNNNEAYEEGNDQTAVVLSDEAQVAAQHEAPEEVEVRSEGWFEAVRVEVPSSVFDSRKGPLGELRDAIYRLGARALGEPLWLQGDEGGGGRFVLQFDESFVDVNLGDSGIMYVWDDGGFWQCH